jgi:hypothetical protein
MNDRCFSASASARLSTNAPDVENSLACFFSLPAHVYRGNFNYSGTYYNLSVTDPAVRNALVGRGEGQYPFTDVYLCVSLTERFEENGRCHKLVAAVIRNPPL